MNHTVNLRVSILDNNDVDVEIMVYLRPGDHITDVLDAMYDWYHIMDVAIPKDVYEIEDL